MSQEMQRVHTLQTESDRLALENAKLRQAAKYALYTLNCYHGGITADQKSARQGLENLFEELGIQ